MSKKTTGMNPTSKCLMLLCIVMAPLFSCQKPLTIPDHWMDSPLTQDPSITDPSFNVSTRFSSHQDPAHYDTPVYVTVHGFTSSTFEWQEFKSYTESKTEGLVSLVLLGGHGRSYEVFKHSRWREWAEPILDELNALVEQGYTNITLCGSSTGGTLILYLLSEGLLSTPSLRHIALIDTIIYPQSTSLYLVPFLRFFLSDKAIVPTAQSETEIPWWYHVRSYHALNELVSCIKHVKKRLKEGIKTPKHIRVSLYQSKQDPVVNPKSANTIKTGLIMRDQNLISLEIVPSQRHVFTRLKGANNATDKETTLQTRVFNEIIGL